VTVSHPGRVNGQTTFLIPNQEDPTP
jgi:hypothetical protein